MNRIQYIIQSHLIREMSLATRNRSPLKLTEILSTKQTKRCSKPYCSHLWIYCSYFTSLLFMRALAPFVSSNRRRCRQKTDPRDRFSGLQIPRPHKTVHRSLMPRRCQRRSILRYLLRWMQTVRRHRLHPSSISAVGDGRGVLIRKSKDNNTPPWRRRR